MIRTFTSILAIAAFAGPALAESVTVQVAGKSPAAVHAEIERAAQIACRHAYGTMHVSVAEEWQCERTAAAEALAKARLIAAASAPVSVASADTMSRPR